MRALLTAVSSRCPTTVDRKGCVVYRGCRHAGANAVIPRVYTPRAGCRQVAARPVVPRYLTELSLAVAFILGFLVRPLSVIGMLFVAQLWLGLYLHPGEWPWLYIFLIFVQGWFFLDNAGNSLGLDGL